ncbi:26S proteasome non-ATPase regulatory subunit 8 [Tetranychus urticae]|uniref:26S proteasome non-ATPase regulatory subunit 8 n=1 Tax=Tetranychus urticae TaxID=32264 RepID=T1KRN8_TETUR|nr:26S proteasome non-ATPase regulatory subunit 8 [Tetranychus urticae]
MASNSQALTVYRELVAEFNRKPPKLDNCLKLLDKLKILLTQLSFLPTNNQVNKQDLIISRDCLEMGAQISVACRDIVAFERYLSQLKYYYFDFCDELPESAYKYQLLGLNLLCLLSQNRVAEFHTELELLPAHEIQNNIYIKHPVNLEQWLMEGCYNKVFLSKENVPAESYGHFVDILLDTVREEIANCLEKAYGAISIHETNRILFLNNISDLKQFAFKRNWKIDDKMLIFDAAKESKPVFSSEIPCEQLACKALEYARELEMIV